MSPTRPTVIPALPRYTPFLISPVMAETCNSRGLSWFAKSCITDSCREVAQSTVPNPYLRPIDSTASIFSLPDDLLLECFSRVPLSSLPSLSLVCRRFSLLLDSPAFLEIRRSRGRLRRSLLVLHISNLGFLTASILRIPIPFLPAWSLSSTLIPYISDFAAFSQPRIAAIGRVVYIIGRGATLRYDSLTGAVSPRAAPIFARKKFAVAAISDRIYVAGGSSRTSAVEEYDPESDSWRVVTEAPRRRYGCVGAAVGEVFYVIGGLRVGREEGGEARRTCPAGSMDAYHVRAGSWLRLRAAVPSGGCVVGACGVGPHLYVVASHAVEISFWRWETGRGRAGGEWARLEPPPLAGQLVGIGSTVWLLCSAFGDGKVVAVVHSTSAATGHGSDSGRRGGEVLVYDIAAGEWTRGPQLPVGFRRAACACVEW